MKLPRLLGPSACSWLALAGLLGALVSACGAGTLTETGAEVYHLTLSHHIPATAPPAMAAEEWARRVEEATGGRVRFTIYPAESLTKGREALEATEGGVCDVAMISLAYVAEEWSLNSVLTLGSLAVPKDRGTEIWERLQERFPEMAAEMGSVKVLAKSLATTTSIHVKDKEIHTPDDVKGLRIAAMGDSIPVLEAAGAIPVNISSADWSVSAEKGVIVGCMAPVYVVTDRGIEATFNSHLDLGLGGGGSAVVMNWEVWNGLPADIQQVFKDLTPWLNEALHSAALRVEAEGWRKCAGQTVIEPTSEELTLWTACFEPSAERWTEDNAAKGPAQEIYDYLRQLAEESPSGLDP